MTLYRLFIQSSSSPMSLTPTAESCRYKCLHHAIITTNIIHQYLSETTLLNGIYQVYQYQWEAAISMLGFALFHPICPFASSTSNAIQTGITNLQIFGTNDSATTLSAANAARNLSELVDLYRKGFQISLTRSSRTPSSSVETPQQDISIDMSLNLSNHPVLCERAKKKLSFAGLDSQSGPMTAFTQLQTAPVTAEEFAPRMVAGIHSDKP